jgi:hypothetical protein
MLSHWVASMPDGTSVQFPAELYGWERRKPWYGDRRDLLPVAAWSAFNTGFPHPDAMLRSSHLSRALSASAAA